MMQKIISSKYNMKEIESKWYKIWEKNGFFHQKINKLKKPFCIIMPPPNVTGSLHLGHALDNTIQDIIIRFKRMKNYNVIWIPGVDHAGIATQKKIEDDIKIKKNILKKDLTKDYFLKKALKWKNLYHEKIKNQLKLLGTSCDWKRERFTLDQKSSEAVRKVFLTLYKKGLIYKGKYIINWCPKCLTAISDIEVKYAAEKGFLWEIKYNIYNSKKYIIIATTRPETIFGDTAIAVNPYDKRYKKLIGKYAIIPLLNKKIPVIGDISIDKNFGTGAVKITPSHDIDDFEISLKYNIPKISIIDKFGNMCENTGKYKKMNRFECRKYILEDLKEINHLIDVKPYKHSVGKCYRCNTIIEPLISTQWFIKMKKLAMSTLKVVNETKSIFIPKKFTKIYISWLKNIKDWCISRQLWWGHKIPVWYCDDCKAIIVSENDIFKCSKCNSINIHQDNDVLDTWFSSALWPMSVLGWPKKTRELKNFYPNNLLVTGRDIIFFWIARMLFMGLEFMKKIPFKKILIHGLILDKEGRKMSKSLNNGIDPIKIINIYGADSLRFMLINNINSNGNDIRFQENKLNSARNFCNKIWNASRFLILNLENYNNTKPNFKLLSLSDKWILTKFNETIKIITNNLNNYKLGEAANEIYKFIWDFFCDWYIEISKYRMNNKNEEEKNINQWILNKILTESMKLLHPFMPFITEEIWQNLPHKGKSIMVSSWPRFNKKLIFLEDKNKMDFIIEGIKAIRNLKAEFNIPSNKKIKIFLYVNKNNIKLAKESIFYFNNLANIENVIIFNDLKFKPKKYAIKITSIFNIYVPLDQLIDLEVEKDRLNKESKYLIKEINRLEEKLNNLDFINKAPKTIINKELKKIKIYKDKFKILSQRLKEI